MTDLVLSLLLVLIPYMNKWDDDQLTAFCMVVDPYIKVEGLDEKDLIEFLQDAIRIEENEDE